MRQDVQLAICPGHRADRHAVRRSLARSADVVHDVAPTADLTSGAETTGAIAGWAIRLLRHPLGRTSALSSPVHVSRGDYGGDDTPAGSQLAPGIVPHPVHDAIRPCWTVATNPPYAL